MTQDRLSSSINTYRVLYVSEVEWTFLEGFTSDGKILNRG
jgi:hypothetical protein